MTTPIDTATREEVAGLLKIARAATPGPWQNGFDDLEGIVSLGAVDDGNVVCLPPLEMMEQSASYWDANALHIATFDPPTVIDLITRLQAETARADEAEKERDEAVNWSRVVDRHGADRFDDLAESWLALEGVQRMHNAVSSARQGESSEPMTASPPIDQDTLLLISDLRASDARARWKMAEDAANALEHLSARNTEMEARAEVLEEIAIGAISCVEVVAALLAKSGYPDTAAQAHKEASAFRAALTQHPTRSEDSSLAESGSTALVPGPKSDKGAGH